MMELGTVLDYDQNRWPIAEDIKSILGVYDLTSIESNIDVVTRETDQKTVLHERFYKAWEHAPVLKNRYVEILREVCVPHMREIGHGPPYYYQAIPTFRVSLPGNMAVGEFHTDGKYDHPDGEINFWMPFTPAYGANSLWVQSLADGEVHSVELSPGSIFVFDAVNRLHGNMVNTTGASRVSIDFRLIAKDKAPRSYSASKTINTGAPFAPGGYYARGEVW